MNIDPIQSQQIAKDFHVIAKSFGEKGGHLYLSIDPKDHTKIRQTNDKGEAASFKEITALVKDLLADQSIDDSVKREILLDYGKITQNFINKKLTGLTKIFFAGKKKAQQQEAVSMVKSKSEELDLPRQLRNFIDIKKGLEMDISKVGTDNTFLPLKAQFHSFIENRAEGNPVDEAQIKWLDEPFCKFSQEPSFQKLMTKLNEKLETGSEREQIDALNQTYGQVCKLYREHHGNKPLGGDETTQIMILILARSDVTPLLVSKFLDALTLADQSNGVTRTLSDLANAMNYIRREASQLPPNSADQKL